jgi:hypothetical protein
MIPDDRAAGLGAGVVIVGADGLNRSVGRLDLRPGAFQVLRPGIPEEGTAKVVGAALRDNVDDAAHRLAVLRFIARGLDLNFLHEIEWRRVAKRTERRRIGAQAAVAAARHVDAVDDVQIVEPASAGHRRVHVTCRAAAADAGCQIQRVGEASPDRDVLQHLIGDRGAHRCRLRRDDRGLRCDVHGFTGAADFQLDRERNCLSEADENVLLLEGFETAELHADSVRAWSQERHAEAPVCVGCRRLHASLTGDRHGCAGDSQTLRVHGPALDRSSRLLRQANPGADHQENQHC